MKITYLTHASVFINIDGIKILTDPWLIGPCWGGELWHYPPHNYSPKNLPKPDIIFFSHGHDDHTHEPTIKKFPKKWFSSTVIAPKFNEPWWENYLNKKFKNIKFFDHNQIKKINNIDFQIFKNDLGDFDSSLKLIYKNHGWSEIK